MTVALPTADYSEFAGIGTEGLDVGDFGIARWKIDHNEGLFVNNQNEFAYAALDVILLNLVKQRVFFPKETDEEHSDPLCKSNNFSDGYPGEGFPVEASGFTVDMVESGNPLPCASCAFKDWGPRKANGKATPPPCKELFTFTFLALNEEVENVPGIISLKGTSIGPAKKYISQFVQRKWPMFVQGTRITLEPNLYMGRKYYVTKLVGLEKQNPDNFREYADVAISAREYLSKPPALQEDTGEESVEYDEGNNWSSTVDAEVVEESTTVSPPPAATPVATPATARPRPAVAVQQDNPKASNQASGASGAVTRPAPARPAAVAQPAPARPAAVAQPAPANVIDAASSGPIETADDYDDIPF